MNRPAILQFPATLRALRGPHSPLGGLALPAHRPEIAGGPPSMFDSAGASAVTMELPEADQGADILHEHLSSSPEVSAMLIVDPAGLWAPGMMEALADATGAPVDRLRVHSRNGLHVRAVIDETLLPAGPGPHRLVRSVHGGQRLSDRRDLFATLLAHSQVCAVLVGPMPTLEAQALVEEMRLLAHLPDAQGVRWMIYLGADHRGLESRIDRLAWPEPPLVLHARPLSRSVSAIWNSLYGAWAAAA